MVQNLGREEVSIKIPSKATRVLLTTRNPDVLPPAQCVGLTQAGFLNLGIIAILEGIILCCGGLSYKLQDIRQHPRSATGRQ